MLSQPPRSKMSRPRPVLNIVCSPHRYIGSLSEEHMAPVPLLRCENDGNIIRHRLSAPFLEQLLRDRGVPIGTDLHLQYTIQAPAIESGSPARMTVKVTADTQEEIDSYYATIMQVLLPFLLV